MPAPPTRAESCPATCHMMTDPQPGPIAALYSRYCLHIYTLSIVDMLNYSPCCTASWRGGVSVFIPRFPRSLCCWCWPGAGRPRQCPLVPIVQSNHYHSYQITIRPHSATPPSPWCVYLHPAMLKLGVKMVSLFCS